MKTILRYLLLLTFILICNSSFGQEKIDENISIVFPGKPEYQDFREDNAFLKAFYFNNDSEFFFASRTVLLEEGRELGVVAQDKTELDKIYRNDISNQLMSMSKKGFVFYDSTKIIIQNHLAYRLKYTEANTTEQGAESIILFLNGTRYVFTYSKVNSFNEHNKDLFLNSISIINPESLLQIAPTTKSRIDVFKYGLYAILIIAFIFYFVKKNNGKSKFGINLKTIYCPSCNFKQPFFRRPKNTSQVLFGGTTCPNCNTNLDKYGNIIS